MIGSHTKMKEAVLDASVAIKWFIKEDGDAEAKKLLEFLQSKTLCVYVPQLFFFEVGNIVSLHSEVSENAAERFIESLFSLELKAEEVTPEYLGAVVKTSRQYKITAYDAAYVVLAHLLNVDLITADKRLKEKVKL